MFSVVGLMLILVAALGSGVLTGWLFWLMGRLRRLEIARDSSDGRLLSQSLDGVVSELAAVREQLNQLEQRAEFNERLLEARASTPPAGTEE
ncbi:MAG: hypothetical protein E4H28_06765 [Gemmatimonadales bacterium]|nr:MAG: hypothetical protein E4H28_06765 [Gemmatimonadales bacterium]